MQKQEDRDITDSFAMKAKSIIHDIPKIGDKFTLSASNITLRARSFTAELSSKEYRDDKKNLVRPQRAYIYLHSDINPNGITGPNDIARTWTVSVSIKAVVKPYRMHAHNDGDKDIFKRNQYYRSEGAALSGLEKMLKEILDDKVLPTLFL